MIVIPLPLRGVVSPPVGVGCAVVGGFFILFEGFQSGPALDPWSTAAVVVGATILAAAVAAGYAPRAQRALGGLIVLLAILSLGGISGYLLGTLLGSLGGTLLVLAPAFPSRSSRGVGTITAADLGTPCPRCGHRIPPWTTVCPYCSSGG